MLWVWFGLCVALIGVECLTVDLVAVWFAVASLIMGIIVAIFPTLDIWWQILIFLAISSILVVLTRPLVKKFLKRNRAQETNLELIINHVGVVTESINNDLQQGAVKINGLIWSARSSDNGIIAPDTLVIVKEIVGNKLIVEIKES